MATVLITQCLQRDFVDPIGHHDPLPNLLHVGYSEAARLLGPEPAATRGRPAFGHLGHPSPPDSSMNSAAERAPAR